MPAYFRRLAQRAGLAGNTRPAALPSPVSSGSPSPRPGASEPAREGAGPSYTADLAVSAMVDALPSAAAPVLRASPAALGLPGPVLAPPAAVASPEAPVPPPVPPRELPARSEAPPRPAPSETPAAAFDPRPMEASRTASDAPALPEDRYLPVTPSGPLEAEPPGKGPARDPAPLIARNPSLPAPLEMDLDMPASGAATVTLRTSPRRVMETSGPGNTHQADAERDPGGPQSREDTRFRGGASAPSPRPVYVSIGSVSLEIRQPAPPPRPQTQAAPPRPRPAAPSVPPPSTPSAGGFRPSRHYLRG